MIKILFALFRLLGDEIWLYLLFHNYFNEIAMKLFNFIIVLDLIVICLILAVSEIEITSPVT
ncbi:hypothetical protein C9J40_20545 [Photobacterium sp. GB-72]|nr:hypothetical protein C9J40_20545 [Photobacterium sp. GB-72]